MRSVDKKAGKKVNVLADWLFMGLNFVIIVVGVFFLTVGTYASVQGIIDSFRDGSVGGVFSCKSNAI